MIGPVIVQPPDAVVINDPNVKVVITWNQEFSAKWSGNFQRAQMFIDSEILRGCEPFIPFKTGILVMTGILATKIGSGWISWTAPYARPQYYMKRKKGSITGPLRGPFWFERWKAVGGAKVIAGAKKIAGGLA